MKNGPNLYRDFSWKFMNNGVYNLSIPIIFGKNSRKFAVQVIRAGILKKSTNFSGTR